MLNDTLEVRRHDFQETKANIKIFSEKRIDSPTFDSVATEKYYGLMSHSVTGSELNERISKIQYHFIKINDQLNEVKGQFGNIYETFESLDKDYIEGMLASIGAANKASDQARIAAERAHEISEEAKKISYDIKRSLQIHVAIIEELEKEKDNSESKFAMMRNEIDQVKTIVNQQYEMLGKLISSQSNSLTEIRKKQANRNDEFVSQIESVRNEARENYQKSYNIYHEQSAIFSKKIQRACILLGAFGVVATVSLLLTTLRAI